MSFAETIPYALDRLVDEADYAVIGPTDGRLTGCTAFLISPTRLLTAAHCIMSPLRGRLGLPATVTRIRVTPGRASASVRPFGSQWASRWVANPAYVRRPSPLHDVAIIDLPRPFSPAPGILQLWSPSRADLERLRGSRLIHVSGYPADKPAGTQWEHAERLDRITERQLLYSVDTCPGHSGSPVWLLRARGGAPAVIAVHTAGPTPHAGGPWGCRPGVPLAPAGLFNRGVRLLPPLVQAIRRGFAP